VTVRRYNKTTDAKLLHADVYAVTSFVDSVQFDSAIQF